MRINGGKKSLMGWLVFALLTLAITGANSGDAARMPKFQSIEVAFDAPDSSVELVGYLTLPHKERTRGDKPPLVILLHQFGESAESWDTFTKEIAQTGFAVFALDLRGHGLSIFDLKMGKNRTKNTYYVGEQLKFPSDIAFLVNKAVKTHADKFDTTRFAVIGADLGGNAGLIYAQTEPRVKYVALISPGLEYYGLRIVPVLREFDDRPVLLACSDKDVYSKESVDMITDLVPRNFDVQTIASMYHGNRLVNTSIPLRIKLLDDLKRYFPN